MHWHEHLELLFYLSDGDKVFCGEKTYTARAGDLIVVNPSELHATYSGRFYCMRISPSFFADVRFDGILIEPHIVKDAAVASSIAQIARVKDADDVGSDMEIKGETYRLIAYLLRNYRTQPQQDEKAVSKKNKANRVRELLLYMTHSCHEHITTAALAERFHLDEHYLCRLFKEYAGKTILAYLTELRIKHACRLLKLTDEPIKRVARLSGYGSQSAFGKAFVTLVGMSPRDYRKHCDGSADYQARWE